MDEQSRRRFLGLPGEQPGLDPFSTESPPRDYSTVDMSFDLDTVMEEISSLSAERRPDVPTASPPRSWTNGRPLEQSIDGFDDSDLPRAAYALPRSMAFHQDNLMQIRWNVPALGQWIVSQTHSFALQHRQDRW